MSPRGKSVQLKFQCLKTTIDGAFAGFKDWPRSVYLQCVLPQDHMNVSLKRNLLIVVFIKVIFANMCEQIGSVSKQIIQWNK